MRVLHASRLSCIKGVWCAVAHAANGGYAGCADVRDLEARAPTTRENLLRLDRTARGVGALGLMVGVFAFAPSAASAATCSDYSTQADAQRAADTRDADGDGIYCEALPCPCLRPGQGGGGGGGSKPPKKPRKRAQVIRGQITDVVDGDTIKVRASGGKRYTVRLIGIDTPETKRPGVKVECGGPEASSSMLALGFSKPVDSDGDGLFDEKGGTGRKVRLTTDTTQDTYDRYKRLLAYADTSAGQLNVSQVAAGWSKVYVFKKRFRQHGRFVEAQRRARSDGRGVWGQCDGDFHSEQ
jgi:micrococcal nuclease